jgi:hypothetical protein
MGNGAFWGRILVGAALITAAGATAGARSAAGDQTTINFATFPDGTQVPVSYVATSFANTVISDQWASLGVNFEGTGQLDLVGGSSTSTDGYCGNGFYDCSGNNMVLTNVTAPATLDTLRIVFAVPQASVQLDLTDFINCFSTSNPVTLLSGGTVIASFDVTSADQIAACPGTTEGICGRFQFDAASVGETYDEIDLGIPNGLCFGGVTPGFAIDNLTFDTGSFGPQQVLVDIQPGTDPAVVHLHGNGNVPVAILGTASFDATTVDPSTVVFEGAPLRTTSKGKSIYSLVDVNADGRLDFVGSFSTSATDLTTASTTACVSGKTTGGASFQGCDSLLVKAH